MNDKENKPKRAEWVVFRAGEPATLEQIAWAMGITREGVRQIEIKAMKKLRKALRERGLTKEDFLGQIEHWNDRNKGGYDEF